MRLNSWLELSLSNGHMMFFAAALSNTPVRVTGASNTSSNSFLAVPRCMQSQNLAIIHFAHIAGFLNISHVVLDVPYLVYTSAAAVRQGWAKTPCGLGSRDGIYRHRLSHSGVCGIGR